MTAETSSHIELTPHQQQMEAKRLAFAQAMRENPQYVQTPEGQTALKEISDYLESQHPPRNPNIPSTMNAE